MDAVSALLQQDNLRLVTLTGPGGVGKTVLALRIAEVVASSFTDGVLFVPLANVQDPNLVATAIAHALGMFHFGERAPVDQLAKMLRDRHQLLILDNFEHLLAAAPLVTDLRIQCPRLIVLVTSRTRLRLAEEHLFSVAPLPVPALEAIPTAVELSQVPSVRLFVIRALAVDSTLEFTESNARAVASICHRLDGLPLAIELAAARSSMFTQAEIAGLLNARLPLLTAGRRDAPFRHGTMRDAIAWSYDLLSLQEQACFRRLAVFVGGFTLEAADAVFATADGRSWDTVTNVAALVDQSLLRHEVGPGGVSRYVMLETLREFGLEQLAETNELEVIRSAHAAYFASLDDELDPNRVDTGERFDDRLLRIEADHPNCLAAMSYLAASEDGTEVLRLAGSLAVFWHHRGHLNEGRRWLEWALDRSANAAPVWRGRGLAGLGLIIWTQGDAEGARPPTEAACAIAKDTCDTDLLALAVHMLGLIAFAQEDWDQAEHRMREAMNLHRARGVISNEAMALNVLSLIARERGDKKNCDMHAEAALVLFRASGNASGTAMALCNRASVANACGDLLRAVADFQEALRLWAGIGERRTIAQALGGLAGLALRLGQPERAALLVGAVEARALEIGADPMARDHRRSAQTAAAARIELGESRSAELHAIGLSMPLASAIEEALNLVVPVN